MAVTKQTLTAVGIALAVGGGFYFWWQGSAAMPDVVGEVVDTAPATTSTKPASPFAVVDDENANVASQTSSSAVKTPKPLKGKTPTDATMQLEAYDVGFTGIGDDQFRDIELRLKTDPQFLQALADELSTESDPERLKRLAFLLGRVPDPSLTPIASDMVYSGNFDSQIAGLDLLRRLQPHDSAARDVVMNILSTNVNAEMIVATLNVLALPTEASDVQKQSVVDHVLPLINNESAKVRMRSIATISKWADSNTASDVLAAGLNDTDEGVRKTAAYSSVDLVDPSPRVIDALFALLEDGDERPSARSAARLSLKSKNLNQIDQQRLEAADAELKQLNAR